METSFVILRAWWIEGPIGLSSTDLNKPSLEHPTALAALYHRPEESLCNRKYRLRLVVADTAH